MKITGKKAASVIILILGLTIMGSIAYASDDNSLAALGITTEGVTVTPDFSYDTWEYDVVVPAGTTELSLSPVPSSSLATIADISGTTLNADGTGTVYITVQAGNGDQFPYTLHVTTAPGPAPAAQPETQAPQPEPAEPETEAPKPEPQTEDNRFVRVDRNTIQEAENTISNLKSDITKYRDTISMYTKIMYGLIAVAVVLLFIVINLILGKKDLKAELNEYKSLGYSNPQASQKAKRPQAAPAGYVQQEQRPQAHPQASRRPQENNQPSRQPQESGHYTNGGQLDVMPQTSRRKNRMLPEYQEENTQPAAPAGKPEEDAAPKAKKPSRKQIQEARKAEEAKRLQEAEEKAAEAAAMVDQEPGSGREVQVDMIDL